MWEQGCAFTFPAYQWGDASPEQISRAGTNDQSLSSPGALHSGPPALTHLQPSPGSTPSSLQPIDPGILELRGPFEADRGGSGTQKRKHCLFDCQQAWEPGLPGRPFGPKIEIKFEEGSDKFAHDSNSCCFICVSKPGPVQSPFTDTLLILRTLLSRRPHLPDLTREVKVWMAYVACLRLRGWCVGKTGT